MQLLQKSLVFTKQNLGHAIPGSCHCSGKGGACSNVIGDTGVWVPCCSKAVWRSVPCRIKEVQNCVLWQWSCTIFLVKGMIHENNPLRFWGKNPCFPYCVRASNSQAKRRKNAQLSLTWAKWKRLPNSWHSSSRCSWMRSGLTLCLLKVQLRQILEGLRRAQTFLLNPLSGNRLQSRRTAKNQVPVIFNSFRIWI